MASEVAVKAYEAAASLLGANRSKLVIGGKVRPDWIDRGARFSYALNTAEGRQHVLVDPVARTREPAFDHERLAAALHVASGEEVDPCTLPVSGIAPVEGAVDFDAFGIRWRFDLHTSSCSKVEGYVARGPLEVVSPDGALAVFRRGHDLWARSLSTGEQWELTSGGTVDHAYGAPTDIAAFTAMMGKLGLPHLPPLVTWSADSTRVVTHRTDQRNLATMQLIDTDPAEGARPRLVEQRYALPGDAHAAQAELLVIDVASGDTVPVLAPPLSAPFLSPVFSRWVWWNDSSVYYLDRPRDVRTLRLHRLSPETGEVSLVLEETGETRVDPAQEITQRPIVRVLSDGSQVLWYSQRDGWGHLYLYDVSTGELCAQVTSGPFAVQEILHVDEAARVVYFVATGLVEAQPYRRSVCRVGLDGTGFARVVDDELDHVVKVPENGEYFIDSASASDVPPVIAVRDWHGEILVELERADISRLEATGWRPPEQFRVVADDGTTDIYGVLYLPHDFDASVTYPVVDHPYPGPQKARVSPAFDPGPYGYDAEALAALGFVVVAMDGRGTPGRSKAFHDESWGRLSDAGCLPDHVTAIKQLAESRPWMDLDRVGIFGRSGGAYSTVRALCEFPDFYRVGVAESGNYDLSIYHLVWSETYDGLYDAEKIARSSILQLADKLEGRLLLVHGGSDDNVTPHHTMRLVERLIAADKDFDLLIVPGAEHSFLGYEHYVARRRWDYFVRHLAGSEPPANFRIAPVPIDFEMLAEMMG